MTKSKIAISVDTPLLDQVDKMVDGSIIRSRSQAIEYFLRKGLREESITIAIILLRGEHQVQSLSPFKGKTLIEAQLDFFQDNGFSQVYIITQHTKEITLLLEKVSGANLTVDLVESDAKGNAQALATIKNKIKSSFVVMSGDTYNNFDFSTMSKKHLSLDKMATMGLMTREKTVGYGTAILDGDLVIDFQEKPKQSSTHIVNAGIYIFKPEIFELFEQVSSLEKDLFSKLARMKQLVGFFTYGEYEHVE